MEGDVIPIEYSDEYYDKYKDKKLVEVLTPENCPSLYSPDKHYWISVYEDGTRVSHGRSKK
jgi:hypothetical protein